MNNRPFYTLITFFIFILSQPSLAQSLNVLDIQKSLIENSTLQKPIEKVNEKLSSKAQDTIDSTNSPQLDLTIATNQNTESMKSLSNRYFEALTGLDLRIYGSSEFNQPQDDSLLFFNTIGKNYQLAPGDTIQITITGLSPSNENYQVKNDGTITLENVYPLNVNNLNLNQVSKLVLDKILLDDASAEVFVRLNNARLVTVQISGNVKSPRTIAVPAYTPLSRVIAYSGGISDSGSLRNISLSQIGETTQTVDFYNFLQNSSPKLDPLIKNGARIFVPFKGPTVAVTGFVNSPGIYELPHDKSEISIKNLLSITGTSFLPFGAELKISYFDTSGQIATRSVIENETLKEGEALQIDFIETRDLALSKVFGAVLKDFEIKTYTPLSIKEVLKNGAVLSLDTYTSFALIVGKEVRAINLDEALEDDSITLPVGSDLRLFTKKEYLGLVASDPNNSSDPIVSKLINSNIAELYLDGKRIAYIPIGKDKELYDSINAFYTPNPSTVFELALLQRKTGVDAFNLNSAINSNHVKKLDKGDRLFIFEDKFFSQLISEQEYGVYYDIVDTEQSDGTVADSKDLEILKLRQGLDKNKSIYSQRLEYSKKILQKSNTIKISLDGGLISVLPFSEGMNSSTIFNNLKNRLPNLMKDFVIVKNTDNYSPISIKSLNYEFKIKQNDNINLISQDNYNELIASYYTTADLVLLNDVRNSDAVKVYYDEKLSLLAPPNVSFSNQKILGILTNSNNFYKLYIGFSTKQKNDNTWTFRSYDASTFFSDSHNLIPNESNEVYMFSEQYIRNNFLNSLDREELLRDTSTEIINKNMPALIEEDTIKIASLDKIEVLENKSTADELTDLDNDFPEYVLKSMASNLRFVSGAVMFPGTYPLADRVRLKDLIDVAGVIETKAASEIVITKSVKEKNELIKSTPEVFELNSLITNEIILSGEFYVEVPKAVNEAINGFINLSGEFKIPGDYAFTRSEPLFEIIQRAGGLTDTAYPLGAVLERQSIKAQEKASNEILATQLEASVLTLAQSDIDGVGEQIKAVLGFSQQLRSQPTTGRMTINIMSNNKLYLQDGDKLMLPKRPSHVSVVGAVQRTTVASYNKNKTFKEYIFSAGGLTKMADVRKAYLLLPNGESRLINRNTIIPAGSVVVVPPKIDKLSVLGLTDIISRVLGNIATSILAINNVN
ncbi:SLBB domain-containing protein [Amylibacter sp.]|nr:SLBB domain-containing protein [Amylibacter sp.]